MTLHHNRSLAIVVACLMAAAGGWTGGALLATTQPELPQIQGPPPLPPGRAGAQGPQTGTGFIAGQVVDQAGRAIAGAVVTLGDRTGRLAPKRLVADSQGRFFFSHLPAGVFTHSIEKPGYAMVSPGAPIDLADDERLMTVKLRMLKLAVVTGVVRDEAGDPVVGTDVIAFRRAAPQGRPPTLTPTGRGRTDDRGIYRLPGLMPGGYFICACSRDPIPFDGQLLTTLAAEPLNLMGVAARALKVGADVAGLDGTLRTFPPTFHPNSPLVSRATRLAIAAGEEKTGVDVDVIAVRAARVSGTIVGASGPVNASALRLVPVGETSEAASLVQIQPMLVQPDGRFDFAGVPPGQYTLHVNYQPGVGSAGPSGAALAFAGARGGAMAAPGGGRGGPPAPTAPPLWAAEHLSVGNDDVTGLSIVLRRGAAISGKFEFLGAATPPAAQVLSSRVVQLLPIDLASAVGRGYIGRVTADGSFQFTGLPPGRYSFVSLELPGWPNAKSVSIGGVEVTDSAIVVESSDLTDMVVTLVDTPLAAIEGGATLGGKPGEADGWVRIFPTERRFWTEPFVAIRRFKSARVTPKGTYSLTAVPSGEYFIVVMPDEFPNEWEEAGRLEMLSRTAQRIRVADGEKKIVDVKR